MHFSSIKQDDNGVSNVNARFEGEDVWLTAEQLQQLFQASQQDTHHHIQQIYADGGRCGARPLTRSCFLLALTVLPIVALSATLSPLPPSEYADTEVSTNIPVVVDFDRMNRLELALSLVPSSSNCVEVAVGADANHDGRLSVEETAYTFGCDCGRWFLRDAAGDGLEAEAEVWAWDGTSCRVERVCVLKKRKLRTEWNLAR